MVNAARSPTFYEFDSMDLLRLYREMDDRDEEPVVDLPLAHGHRGLPVAHRHLLRVRARRPLRARLDPGDRRGDGPYELRSYRIVDGVVTEEEPVEIVEVVR
jgi:[CysO sulfur-carrier protein]-S-L-cysteine hydrolase